MTKNQTKEAMDLLTSKGFDDLFFKKLADNVTHREAYDAAEQVYEKYWYRRKYKSFQSYRVSRDRRIKNN
jgi:hypothetical protein